MSLHPSTPSPIHPVPDHSGADPQVSAHLAGTAAELGHAATELTHSMDKPGPAPRGQVAPRNVLLGVAGLLVMTVGVGYPIIRNELFGRHADAATISASTAPVPVKAKRDGQPVPAGYTLRPEHSTAFTLDGYGETMLPADLRGRRYELWFRDPAIPGARDSVVHTGMVPLTGPLDIDLK